MCRKIGDQQNALKYCQHALDIFIDTLGPEDKKTEDCLKVLNQIQNQKEWSVVNVKMDESEEEELPLGVAVNPMYSDFTYTEELSIWEQS